MAIKVGMVSLGCPKNQVDAEILLHQIVQNGYELSSDPAMCDVVIINTCGFIQDAKEEAIENILEFITLKKEGKIQSVIVTGCLAERYQKEIREEMPEIDAVLGIGSNHEICEAIERSLQNQITESFGAKENLCLNGERILTTLPFYAYLKIAEGCDNCCSYCAIPQIRGRFRSRPMEDILQEARLLAEDGVKELVLVAQDVTRYGEDLYGSYRLAALLDALCDIEGLEWIRILYCYPDKITDELLEVMASQPKIAKYMDIPLQHCNDEILREMNRPYTKAQVVELLTRIREKIPNITLRTTLITGFPGETEAQFEELVQFIKDQKFTHLGCFSYSEEEGTPAASMEPQIPEEVRKHRAELIMEEQWTIVQQTREQQLGQTLTIVLEGADKIAGCYFGRSEADAPDIDGKVFFTSPQTHTMGDFLQVKITDLCDYDLVGEEVCNTASEQ